MFNFFKINYVENLNSHRKIPHKTCKVKFTVCFKNKFSTGCGKQCGKLNLTVLYHVNPLHYKLYKPLFNILWYSWKWNGFSTDFLRFFPLSTNTFHQSSTWKKMYPHFNIFPTSARWKSKACPWNGLTPVSTLCTPPTASTI